MRILELFAGYGSQKLALKYLGIDVESEISEIDRFAVQAYNQIHGETQNYGDICKIDETRLSKYDLVTYSSPCQDFSNAGLQKGGDEGAGTRSSLLWECRRIISATKPKYLLMENVKALTCKKFMPCFHKWLQTLDDLGYDNYWRVLNAKDYGIPQNRERVFVVSIRKDIDQGFEFPKPMSLDKRLKDFLEPIVDEKFYLSDKIIQGYLAKIERGKDHPSGFNQRINICNNDNISTALTASYHKCGITNPYISEPIPCVQKDNYAIEPQVLTPKRTEYGKQIRKAYENGDINESRHNMTIQEPRTDGISNTITTVLKDNYLCEPLKVKVNTKKGYAEAYCGDSINLDQPSSKTRRGRVGHQVAQTLTCSCNQAAIEPLALDEQNEYIRKNGTVGTLTTDGNSPKHNNRVIEQCYSGGLRIRKLTPRECWRLMGVKDEDFDKLKDISNTQLYKLAGNSIVTNVMMAIFENLFINKTAKRPQEKQLTLF